MMLLAAKRFNDTLARPSLPLASSPLLFAPLRYSSAEKIEEGEKESFERRVRGECSSEFFFLSNGEFCG